MKRKLNPFPIWSFFVLFLLIHNPGISQKPNPTQGDLVGHIYEKGGIAPVGQAIVQIKRLPSGQVYSSNPSDGEGMFRVRGIEKGVYLIGVKTSFGNFNGQKLLGILISDDVTAQIEIVLSSQEKTSDALFFVPLLPNPVGHVSIAAGNQAVFDGIMEIKDESGEAGPFRINYPE